MAVILFRALYDPFSRDHVVDGFALARTPEFEVMGSKKNFKTV
jgi:hypothetical protein